MSRRTLTNWLSLSGVIAVMVYFLHVYIGQMNYPGYDWMRQAVSDLTAVDAPSYLIASRYTSIYGSLSCLCCIVLCILIQHTETKTFRLGIYLYTIMNCISYVGYTLYPLSSSGYSGTFQDVMHFYVVTISVVLLSIASMILIFVGGIKNKRNRYVAIFAAIALACMFFGSVGVGFVPPGYFGLVERFSVFSVVIFTGILGIYGFSISR